MSDFDASTIVIPDPGDWLPTYVKDAWAEEKQETILEWVVYGDRDAEQAPEDTPEDRFRDYCIWRGRRKPQWWVNIYTTHEEKGGPEEGGWWYTVHVPAITLPCFGPFDDYVKACEISHMMRDTHPVFQEEECKEGRYAIVERYPARVYPKHRPHYC